MATQNVTESQRAAAESALAFSEDALLAQLALFDDELEPRLLEGDDETSLSLGDVRARGRAVLNRNKEKLRRAICEDFQMCRKLGDPDWQNNVTLVEYLGDWLIPVIPGLPTYAIAALLCHRGFRKFCDCS